MKLFYPAYYRRFRCIADRCPDSCCHAWAVAIDDDAAAFYRTVPGDLGDVLRKHLTEEDGDTILSLTADGRCPMWRTDGLCRLQCELGEQALCQVCRDFPRLRHDYGSFAELGLELSCPEAARLILSGDTEMVQETVSGGEAPEYDEDAMAILLQSRETLLHFLENREIPVNQALAAMLLYGYDVQNWLDGGEDAVLDLQLPAVDAAGDSAAFLDFFRELEILTPQWKQCLESPQGSCWQEAHRAIARYGIQRYWLQAVSDYDLVGRVKLILALCLVVKWVGGDIVRTSQLCSKEIENDADNIDAILDGAYISPALSDVNLLALLRS